MISQQEFGNFHPFVWLPSIYIEDRYQGPVPQSTGLKEQRSSCQLPALAPRCHEVADVVVMREGSLGRGPRGLGCVGVVPYSRTCPCKEDIEGAFAASCLCPQVDQCVNPSDILRLLLESFDQFQYVFNFFCKHAQDTAGNGMINAKAEPGEICIKNRKMDGEAALPPQCTATSSSAC